MCSTLNGMRRSSINNPSKMKRKLAKKKARFYTVNTIKIAEEIGLGNRINMVMQELFLSLLIYCLKMSILRSLRMSSLRCTAIRVKR